MFQLWAVITLLFSINFFAKPVYASECSYMFRYAGIFQNGRNPLLIEKMRALQADMGEVNIFLQMLNNSAQARTSDMFQRGFHHAKALVLVSRELLEHADSYYAPASIMQKPLEERKIALRAYSGMYKRQLEIFEALLKDFVSNEGRHPSLWNFQDSQNAFFEIQTLMTIAHKKF